MIYVKTEIHFITCYFAETLLEESFVNFTTTIVIAVTFIVTVVVIIALYIRRKTGK